jgi:hypothetical protein
LVATEAPFLFPLGHLNSIVGLVTWYVLIGYTGSGTDACGQTRPLRLGKWRGHAVCHDCCVLLGEAPIHGLYKRGSVGAPPMALE